MTLTMYRDFTDSYLSKEIRSQKCEHFRSTGCCIFATLPIEKGKLYNTDGPANNNIKEFLYFYKFKDPTSSGTNARRLGNIQLKWNIS